jgi:protein MPE1
LPSDSSLACPICSKLFRDAVTTPCCSRTYDEECLQTHLLERDFTCPGCQSKITSLDKLRPDYHVRGLVQRYIDEEITKASLASVSEHTDDDDVVEVSTKTVLLEYGIDFAFSVDH